MTYAGGYTSTGAILVLFILLVIISRTARVMSLGLSQK
jgi:uncharacterized protein (TIGR01732 family)